MKVAKWVPGTPAVAVNAAGTVTASIPLLDAGVLAATVMFTMTADRALMVTVQNEPGAAGLSNFQAWSANG